MGHAVDFGVELAFAEAVLAQDRLEFGAHEPQPATHGNRVALLCFARRLLTGSEQDRAIRLTVKHMALENAPRIAVARGTQRFFNPAARLAKRGADPRAFELALGAAVARLDRAGRLAERFVTACVRGASAWGGGSSAGTKPGRRVSSVMAPFS